MRNRNTGRKRRRERLMSMPRWALWFVMQFSFIVMICALMMMPFIVWGDLGSSEETWTDFSAPVEEVIVVEETAEIDKEKYRIY